MVPSGSARSCCRPRGSPEVSASSDDIRPVPAGDRDERVRVLAGDRPCRGAIAVVAAAVLEVFGQGDQAGSAGRRLCRKIGGPGDVRVDVTGRVELDEGDRQAHPAIVCQRMPVSYASSMVVSVPG